MRSAVVAAGDDPVPDAGAGAVVQVDSVGLDVTRVDAVEAGAGVEGGDSVAAAGDEQAGASGRVSSAQAV